jgi:hypothetical protein
MTGAEKTLEVMTLLKTVSEDCPEPQNIIRLGKYKPDTKRHTKVCFTTETDAVTILKNRKNLKNNVIKIFGDQTPQQQAHYKAVKKELERRTSNGETSLNIKYVKGIPKIVQEVPKNFN